MREIFDQDRAMSLSTVKRAIGIVGIFLALTAALVVLTGLGRIFSGDILAGAGRIVATLAMTGFMYVILRLGGEILLALHRLNDRLYLVGDDLRQQRVSTVSDSDS